MRSTTFTATCAASVERSFVIMRHAAQAPMLMQLATKRTVMNGQHFSQMEPPEQHVRTSS
jgi:hypothetical protein